MHMDWYANERIGLHVQKLYLWILSFAHEKAMGLIL